MATSGGGGTWGRDVLCMSGVWLVDELSNLFSFKAALIVRKDPETPLFYSRFEQVCLWVVEGATKFLDIRSYTPSAGNPFKHTKAAQIDFPWQAALRALLKWPIIE